MHAFPGASHIHAVVEADLVLERVRVLLGELPWVAQHLALLVDAHQDLVARVLNAVPPQDLAQVLRALDDGVRLAVGQRVELVGELVRDRRQLVNLEEDRIPPARRGGPQLQEPPDPGPGPCPHPAADHALPEVLRRDTGEVERLGALERRGQRQDERRPDGRHVCLCSVASRRGVRPPRPVKSTKQFQGHARGPNANDVPSRRDCGFSSWPRSVLAATGPRRAATSSCPACLVGAAVPMYVPMSLCV